MSQLNSCRECDGLGSVWLTDHVTGDLVNNRCRACRGKKFYQGSLFKKEFVTQTITHNLIELNARKIFDGH